MWQPIETAPKDKGRIIVFGKWDGHQIVRWVGAPHNIWTSTGFDSVQTPTHWMPLPEPPAR